MGGRAISEKKGRERRRMGKRKGKEGGQRRYDKLSRTSHTHTYTRTHTHTHTHTISLSLSLSPLLLLTQLRQGIFLVIAIEASRCNNAQACVRQNSHARIENFDLTMERDVSIA